MKKCFNMQNKQNIKRVARSWFCRLLMQKNYPQIKEFLPWPHRPPNFSWKIVRNFASKNSRFELPPQPSPSLVKSIVEYPPIKPSPNQYKLRIICSTCQQSILHNLQIFQGIKQKTWTSSKNISKSLLRPHKSLKSDWNHKVENLFLNAFFGS